MTDDELKDFLSALDKATTLFQTEGILWSRLIHATTGRTVIPFDPTDRLHREVIASISRAASAVIDVANSTGMSGWGARRVNELGNALEDRFSRSFNDLSLRLRCEGFSQSTGYPDRRLILGDEVVAYVDMKTYESGSETSRFRSFYHQPRQARSKITASALHLLLAFPHAPAEESASRGFWRLESFHVVDLANLRVRLKGEFQASNHDLYTVLNRIEID